MKYFSLTALALSVSFTTQAGELGSKGFEGEITALMGISSKTSNFNTDEKVKTGALNTEAESDSEFLIAPLGQVRYTFGQQNNHQLFLGTSRADITEGNFFAEVGYKFGLGQRSAIAFSYLPSLGGETWADPFVINQAREETDLTSHAFRIKYDNILESAFSFDLAYYTVDIEDELSGVNQTGSLVQSLDRNGNGLYSKLTYTRPIGQSALFDAAVLYNSFSADGDAMSNDKLGLELSYKTFIKRHAFVLTTRYKQISFDDIHPIFNQEQEDDKFSLFAGYEYADVMDWKNVSFNALVGYDMTSSNIEFYESSGYIAGIGLSYKF